MTCSTRPARARLLRSPGGSLAKLTTEPPAKALSAGADAVRHPGVQTTRRSERSAPAQLRRDVPDDAVQQVRVVVDAELVRDRQQQRVRGGDRLVPGELLDELVGLPGVRLAESGQPAVDEADLVLAAGLAPK